MKTIEPLKMLCFSGYASLMAVMPWPAAGAVESIWPQSGIDAPELGGRLQYDLNLFDNDDRGDKNTSGTEIRRVWLGVSGKLYDFDYMIEFDFADNDAVAKSVFLAHRLGPGTLSIGQFKQAFSLNDVTSSKYTTFTERSYLAQTLAPSFQTGIGYLGAIGHSSFSGTVYNLDNNDPDAADGMGGSIRLTTAPVLSDSRVVHLGGSFAYEAYGENNDGPQPVLFRVRPAGHMSDASRTTLLAFDDGSDVDGYKYSIEFAAVMGPLSFQSEYGGADYESDSDDGKIQTYYGYVSYFLTGEHRAYSAKSGAFSRVSPGAASGAWELAARYDLINGKQHGAAAGEIEVEGLTLGVNWYMNPYVRVMFDYTDSHIEDRDSGSTLDDTQALTARLALEF